jgi:pantetheine-phosphate adenylyltransferase
MAFYPGSFDPFTKGHKNIVDRTLKLFNKLVIGIGKNINKPERFISIEQTKKDIENTYIEEIKLGKLEVIHYDINTVDIMKQLNINIIVRGIRTIEDYIYEKDLFEELRLNNKDIEVIFLFSHINISSTEMRQLK